MTETYQERVGRYRIIRHEELPAEHKAALRINGIDPDDNWSLIWSFDEEAPAQEQLASCVENACSFQTYKLVDAGETQFITRQAWF